MRKLVIFILTSLYALHVFGHDGTNSDQGVRQPIVALKSNLLHDAILTPDIGIELSLSGRISVGVEGVYAWWSNDNAHRYWRIRGAWIDASWWFGRKSRTHRLTGHHAGIYASVHDFDFEFGGKGWQSHSPALGVGATYGYSLHLNRHLNLDLYVRAGYAGVGVTEYKPMCATYVCARHLNNRYFGLTGLGVTLVWFPGGKESDTVSR